MLRRAAIVVGVIALIGAVHLGTAETTPMQGLGITLYVMQEGLNGDGTPETAEEAAKGGKIFDLPADTLVANFAFDPELAQATKRQPTGLALDTSDESVMRFYFAAVPDPTLFLSKIFFWDEGTGDEVYAGNANGVITGAGMHDGTYYYVNDQTDDLHAVTFTAAGLIDTDAVLYSGFTNGAAASGYRTGDVAISCEGDMYVSSFHAGADPTDPSKTVDFYSIDLGTGAYTLIDTSFAPDAWELAFGSDGVLYGHDPSSTEFFTVDTSNGDTTLLGFAIGTDFAAMTDLTSNPCADVPDVPPAAPSALVATDISDTEVDLNWTDNSDNETSFRIKKQVEGSWVNVDSVGADVTTWSDTGLTPGETYCYRVQARNSAGNSSSSNTSCATPGAGVDIPLAPSDLVAAGASDTQIDLNWVDNSDDEDSFRIKEQVNGGGWSNIASVGADITTYSRTGLNLGDVYCYRVKARNVAGDSSNSNTSCSMTGVVVPPAAPSNLMAITQSTSQIDLTWDDNSDNEESFRIKERISGGSWVNIASVGADVTNFSSTGLASSTEYCYRVRARNEAGESANTSTQCATTDADPASPAETPNVPEPEAPDS